MTEDDLQADAAKLEQVLAEIRELVPLPAWQRVEDALRRVVRLYGAGLSRAIDHARSTGADARAFDRAMIDDELLASLLVLHGLHPQPFEERVHRAVARVRGELGLADDALVLVAIDRSAVQLAASGGLQTGAMAPSLAESIVRRVIETAAPEVTSIAITGIAPPRDPSLVQLRVNR
jgi:hypothetical protein